MVSIDIYLTFDLLTLPLFQSLYMFLGLAIICDDYFVASLEQIVEVKYESFKDSRIYMTHKWYLI